jgi:hypothetical protein
MRPTNNGGVLGLAIAVSVVACASVAGRAAPAAAPTAPSVTTQAAPAQPKPAQPAPAQPAPAQPAPAKGQPPMKGQAPVNADAKALAGLQGRINEYVALHRKLEHTLPNLSKEATPQDIDNHQRALTRLLQNARRGAKPGDIFVPESRAVIRRLLARVFGGPDGAALKSSIRDENPGTLPISINARYPDSVPVTTMPPQVLEGLPKLPEELEYRFLGRRLILMDVHAHMIADFVENAIPR